MAFAAGINILRGSATYINSQLSRIVEDYTIENFSITALGQGNYIVSLGLDTGAPGGQTASCYDGTYAAVQAASQAQVEAAASEILFDLVVLADTNPKAQFWSSGNGYIANDLVVNTVNNQAYIWQCKIPNSDSVFNPANWWQVSLYNSFCVGVLVTI